MMNSTKLIIKTYPYGIVAFLSIFPMAAMGRKLRESAVTIMSVSLQNQQILNAEPNK